MGAGGSIRSLGCLQPTFEVWGGAEWFIHEVLGALAGRGIASTLYTHRWSDPPGEAGGRGAAAYGVVCHRRGGVRSGPWDWEAIARRLAPSWAGHDVLFVHNHPAALWCRHAPRRAALPPAVWYCHEPPAALYGAGDGGAEDPPDPAERISPARLVRALGFYGGRSLPWLAGRLRERWAVARAGREAWLEELRRRDREAISRVDVILANSRHTASRVRAIYGREAAVVHPVPADLASFRPAGGAAKRPVVLWVGRMTGAKRPLKMVDAWARALRLEPALRSWKLVLVGEGPLARRALEAAGEAGADGSVEARSRLSRAALAALYGEAALLVHLARGEPFGLVPLEAMAAGTAVLAEGGGGVRETIVEGRTGWCVDGLEVDELARRLARLPSERAALESMGRAAAEHVHATFRFESVLASLLEVLETCARRGAQPATAGAGSPK
jgi:glycosyltransferase involved in cell wall biosynthesis